MKIRIENLEFQCHLQGKARVNPAPATLAVNGHGITLTIFHLFSHPYTFHPAHPPLASPPPPPHIPGHIIYSEPHLSYLDKNENGKFLISMSLPRQGQGLGSSSHPGR
jgi:hypothetical protein